LLISIEEITIVIPSEMRSQHSIEPCPRNESDARDLQLISVSSQLGSASLHAEGSNKNQAGSAVVACLLEVSLDGTSVGLDVVRDSCIHP